MFARPLLRQRFQGIPPPHQQAKLDAPRLCAPLGAPGCGEADAQSHREDMRAWPGKPVMSTCWALPGEGRAGLRQSLQQPGWKAPRCPVPTHARKSFTSSTVMSPVESTGVSRLLLGESTGVREKAAWCSSDVPAGREQGHCWVLGPLALALEGLRWQVDRCCPEPTPP